MESFFNLDNKHILITGASRGLGSVCAKVLSEQGAKLVLIARTKEKLVDVKNSCHKPEKHLVISADLTETSQLHKGINTAKEFLGHMDCVLHVAGAGLGLRDPLLSKEDLYKLFMLNVGVAVEINRLVAPDMTERGHGNLVHVGSIASTEATGSVGYNTVKAALAAYVRSLGREMACSGVVVTGILPGGFYAPENAMARLEKTKPEIYKQFIKERLPRKFMGKAEELIPMIQLLCSDYASMMSGCLVPIDAGEGLSYVL
jgi:3-oxoacyl-[acyl-carrier protein] reductase